MSLFDLIDLEVKRREEGKTVAGVYQPGAEFPIWIKASRPQPLQPREVEQIPEWARTKARLMLFVPSGEPELTVTDIDGDRPSDRVLWLGKRYAVIAYGDWSTFISGISHRMYVLLEQGADESTS